MTIAIVALSIIAVAATLHLRSLRKREAIRLERQQAHQNLTDAINQKYAPTPIVAAPEAKHPLDSVPYPLVSKIK